MPCPVLNLLAVCPFPYIRSHNDRKVGLRFIEKREDFIDEFDISGVIVGAVFQVDLYTAFNILDKTYEVA